MYSSFVSYPPPLFLVSNSGPMAPPPTCSALPYNREQMVHKTIRLVLIDKLFVTSLFTMAQRSRNNVHSPSRAPSSSHHCTNGTPTLFRPFSRSLDSIIYQAFIAVPLWSNYAVHSSERRQRKMLRRIQS